MRRALLLLLAAALTAPAAASSQGLRGEQAIVKPDYRGEAGRLRREIEELQRELVGLGVAQFEDEGEAVGQRQGLVRLNTREARLQAEIAANRTQLTRLLGALQLYQRDPPPPLFVHAGSARDAARAAVLMKTVAPELERRGEALAEQADAMRKVRRDVALASETLILTESELEERRADIERLIARKSQLERRLLADADAADRTARQLAAQAGSLGELVQDLADYNQPLRQSGVLAFMQPVQGQLVGRFGEKSGALKAEGLTWRTAGAAQVLAPADARVEYVGPLKGYGLVVILRPSDAYHVVLAGLDQAASGAGRSVAAGEPIGRMANESDAPRELYFEVRRNGEPVDPARWLQASQNRRVRG
jgi:septal ring factor EnvC (AmiA/AmiB activator)